MKPDPSHRKINSNDEPDFFSCLQHQLERMKIGGKKLNLTVVPFLLILVLGIAARIWEYQQLPPGLHQDEASVGVEAYSLLRFGVDRFGYPYPVNFVSWGDGQNSLYSYLLIPFIALGGLTPFTVRLPMLIAGILSLSLVFFVARRTFNEPYALIAMFLLAISPWHIMMSRWGLESNIAPFIFLLGYACLLKSSYINKWFYLACFFFALCLYGYAPGYVAIPMFIFFIILSNFLYKRIEWHHIFVGLVIFALIALPIGLLVFINSLHLNSLQLGPFTIPRYPFQARYETMSVGFNQQGLSVLIKNLKTLLTLLVAQQDDLLSNSIQPYGYFYGFTFPFAIIGCILLLSFRNSQKRFERLLILGWLLASVSIGVISDVNINRINLIFIPLLLCLAFPLEWLREHHKALFALSVLLLLVCFSLFTVQYHSPAYRQAVDGFYFTGFIPALDYARQSGDEDICVTDQVNQPYIFALFSEKMDPKLYLNSIQSIPADTKWKIIALGRYTFGMANCPKDAQTVYVLLDEQLPENGIQYTAMPFGKYFVYTPEKHN